jgi:hypothetical protein
MVFAATAWHRVDPAVRYRKAADVLQPGGYLAVWGAGHVIPDGGDPFVQELQEIYDEIGESLPPDATLPRSQELGVDRGELQASGLFGIVDVTPYDWETVYDADGYIGLLNTFSGTSPCRTGSETASTARSADVSLPDRTAASADTGVASSRSPEAV